MNKKVIVVPYDEAWKNAFEEHHLYVCPQWFKELYRQITFRNLLRSTPEAVKKYGSTKETVAQLFPDDIEKYMEYKSPCIEELYEMCGIGVRNHGKAFIDISVWRKTRHFSLCDVVF